MNMYALMAVLALMAAPVIAEDAAHEEHAADMMTETHADDANHADHANDAHIEDAAESTDDADAEGEHEGHAAE
ncbi:MAG: hypothetical protein COY40_01825 [Alphaproteobacteria bacterium CG_4_10_14_0_8_um_filter_53_9]|nr:MAG: hypothetical protein COY40_01825 [Alphaproteobacteria bacterium CG_4_10_14_0_8_um_filter_53_9]